MNKVEVNPVTIIIMVVAALIIGIVTGAVSVGKYLVKEFKRLINKLRAIHKEDLKFEKEKFRQDLSNKDEILKKKDGIIEELLNLLRKKDEKGKSLIDTTIGLKTFNVITTQRKRMNNNHGIAG